MAGSSDHTRGYQCEFIDSVSEDFYCKKCTLVARRLTVCNSCMESYCYACITDTQKQGQPCPTCGEERFQALPQVKYQKRMKELRVYCSLKERGCGWSGTLDQLDTHLDPDQDNCQYVDTKCPLNCHQTIPKNKVEKHVAQHRAKRPYVCQYCSFEANYEEVVGTHLPECKKFPLQCPNLCGVTFEHDFMEDHLKMCRLEEVGCEFSGVGCEEMFRREDQEENTRQNSQKHLTLTASLAKQLQEKLEQQDKKLRKEERMFKLKIVEHEKKMEEQQKKQEKKIKEQEKKQEKKMEEQEKKMEEQHKVVGELKQILKEEQKQKLKDEEELLEKKFNHRFQELEEMLKELIVELHQNEAKHSDIISSLVKKWTFEVENYRKNIKKEWTSPAMYTHTCGYKFSIRVGVNLYNQLIVDIYSVPGEFDSQLNWPAMAMFTIELINQQGGKNAGRIVNTSWGNPTHETLISHAIALVEISRLHYFLDNDTLHFCISEVELQ